MVVFGFARVVVFFAAGLRAAVVRRAAGLRVVPVASADFRDFAAVVSDSAAVTMALVAVFIAFMAVFIACAEDVAFVAAAVILVAALETLVAALETLVAAAAGVTDVLRVLDVFLAAVFRAPLVFFVRFAVERRPVERFIVFVGTDPIPPC